jgi:hypothetical protein
MRRERSEQRLPVVIALTVPRRQPRGQYGRGRAAQAPRALPPLAPAAAPRHDVERGRGRAYRSGRSRPRSRSGSSRPPPAIPTGSTSTARRGSRRTRSDAREDGGTAEEWNGLENSLRSAIIQYLPSFGWEAAIRSPITWSRDRLTGSRPFLSVRFPAVYRAPPRSPPFGVAAFSRSVSHRVSRNASAAVGRPRGRSAIRQSRQGAAPRSREVRFCAGRGEISIRFQSVSQDPEPVFAHAKPGQTVRRGVL